MITTEVLFGLHRSFVQQFYVKIANGNLKLWHRVVRKAESEVINISQHIQDYNNTSIGDEKYRIGELRIPKLKPCGKGESCRNCKKGTVHDQKMFEKHARERNSKFMSYTQKYFDACFDRVKHQILTDENNIKIN